MGHGSEHNIWNKIFKMDQVKFMEKSHLKIFKGCHSQISLGSFLNTLFHLFIYINSRLCPNLRNILRITRSKGLSFVDSQIIMVTQQKDLHALPCVFRKRLTKISCLVDRQE